ncbi:MAG: hypothetical protein AABP62_09300 [Planctomycetota bacterium]
MRIVLVLMLIVAISIGSLWWPRRGIMAVVRVGGFPIDHQSEVRAAKLLSWMPAGAANAVRPMLEDRASWLSTDEQITLVDMTRSNVDGAWFAKLRRFPQLVRVSVLASQLDEGIEELSRISTLKAVWVEGTDSTTDLSELKRIPTLTTVMLSKPPNTSCHLNGLRDAPQLKTVFLIGAAHTALHLEEIGQLDQLERLTLENCIVQDGDFLALGCLNNHLTTLAVSGRRPVGATGLKHIALIKSLQRLTLSPCSATDDELQSLVDLHHLKDLSLRGPNFTPDGIDRLKQALPKCVIDAR